MTSSTVTVWTMQVGAPSAAALSRWHAVLDSRDVAQAARAFTPTKTATSISRRTR
jgi:hypothetical protein